MIWSPNTGDVQNILLRRFRCRTWLFGLRNTKDYRNISSPYGCDRDVIAPSATVLPEFGDERNAGECIEGKLKALKFGPGLDIVSAKEHTGFGCHDAFLLWRQELCVA